MHFTKDKTMKAHMVIEKPETMLMMQRDSQILERALQDSGLSGNALSFELGGQEQNPGNGFPGHGGHESASHGRSSGNGDPLIIESTMTWYVDAETGQQHCNILA